ncbi:MAG: 2OG-Fe(II) oxygenase [Rhodospirillaceae bacterium]
MPTLTGDLATLLATVSRPGDYFASGTVEIMAPLIEVDGVGPIALPLLPVQAEQLAAVAEPAPYGRGEETLVDTAVRRTWQIGAERIHIRGKHWAGTLDSILARVADGLGLTEPVSAELYKMLVYDRGSFFVGHRDTEKAPGMFATLVVVLPSLYTGGELVVRHKGREVQLDLCCDEPSEVGFAAFYADCVHEVRPVTEGCRLTLIYNLVRPGRGKGRLPEPPDYEAEQLRAAALLQSWDESGPQKLIYPLEHAYTPAELGIDTLKGADAAVAGVLVAAAQRASCDLHLALLSIEESGSAECHGGYRRGRYGDDGDDDFEVGEVYDRNVALTDWRRPDGGPPIPAALPVMDDELSPPGALEDIEPDEVNFREATGNEGASFERSYRRASLVLWPRERFLAVLNQAGLPATLPYLADLAGRMSAAGLGHEAPEWQQAHELAGHMLSGWSEQPWHSWRDKAPTEAARMLAALVQLGDSERIEALLAKVTARGGFARDDAAVFTEALVLLPRDRALILTEHLCAAAAPKALAACANLLVRCAAAAPLNPAADLANAAVRLIEALPKKPETPGYPGDHPSQPEPGLAVDLLSALTAIDETLAGRAVNHMLAWPKVWGFDAVLVPAVAVLIAMPEKRWSPALEGLHTACLDHLRARIAETLEPPADWQRGSALPCACRDCVELARFLSDPGARSWEFRAAEARRRHVKGSIRTAGSDVDTATVRQGSPHRLVCVKNQASYECRVKQRQQDIIDLARLESGKL